MRSGKISFRLLLASIFGTKRERNMSSQQLNIFNFAFLDLETTGLPSGENNKTRITELSITIVESKHVSLGVYPRVRNKLSLCFNPCKLVNPLVTEMTGLANDILENQSSFSNNVVNTINEFLNTQKKPICFVAHNGNKFDYPVLRADIIKAGGNLNEDVLCIDSLLCFQDLHKGGIERREHSSNYKVIKEPHISEREEVDMPEVTKCKPMTGKFFQNAKSFSDEYDQLLCTAVDEYEKSIKIEKIQKLLETTPKKQIIGTNSKPMSGRRNLSNSVEQNKTSFKLCDIYKRLTFKDPVHSHHAEADVDCLIHCAAVYGEDFVEWANRNAKLFSSIPPMRPGIRIGF